ncbi:uncharacterized protein LOC113467447 [Diaphorina citri]|uniref:Uncharacterized protein LOC113467447 n=1 Tax=Diaphorina citri TaxID=121845 RepID=A0A3Q0IT47_DIACI|nr:uncharacterized protein LOC113467447 [Diaphorina citri]
MGTIVRLTAALCILICSFQRADMADTNSSNGEVIEDWLLQWMRTSNGTSNAQTTSKTQPLIAGLKDASKARTALQTQPIISGLKDSLKAGTTSKTQSIIGGLTPTEGKIPSKGQNARTLAPFSTAQSVRSVDALKATSKVRTTSKTQTVLVGLTPQEGKVPSEGKNARASAPSAPPQTYQSIIPALLIQQIPSLMSPTKPPDKPSPTLRPATRPPTTRKPSPAAGTPEKIIKLPELAKDASECPEGYKWFLNKCYPVYPSLVLE